MDKIIHNLISIKHVPLIDVILSCNIFDIAGKLFIIKHMINIVKPNNNLGISLETINKLLQIKVETNNYLKLFSEIIIFGKKREFQLFKYEHLYHLILQPWQEFSDRQISNDFRKKMISTCFSTISNSILNKLKRDIEYWFDNSEKNPNVTEMFAWLCSLDSTGQLSKANIIHKNCLSENELCKKNFQKCYHMTIAEYDKKRDNTKKNGLCKYPSRECPRNVKCIFYHGKREEIFGKQECKNGKKCPFNSMGTCKYIHHPTEKQLYWLRNFYSNFQRIGKYYVADVENIDDIDEQCMDNPFVVLKKKGMIDQNVYYVVPVCSAMVKNELYDLEYPCKKSVCFMTKDGVGGPNFYCSYEHMMENEMKNVSYVVKQNMDALNSNLDKQTEYTIDEQMEQSNRVLDNQTDCGTIEQCMKQTNRKWDRKWDKQTECGTIKQTVDMRDSQTECGTETETETETEYGTNCVTPFGTVKQNIDQSNRM